MADPRTTAFAQAFLSADPVDREELKKRFWEETNTSFAPFVAFNTLRAASDLIGEDITNLADRAAVIPPLPALEAKQIISEAESNVSWIRRGTQKMFGAAEWWNENIAKTGAALALQGQAAIGLNPTAKAEFERVRERQAAAAAISGKKPGLQDVIDASREAYGNTNMITGLKGFMELVFDPLNLIGIGIPAKVGTSIPALSKVMFPLKVLDEAPVRLVNEALKIPPKILSKAIPGSMAPHDSSKVREAMTNVYAEFSGAFGVERWDGTIADTKDILGDLTRFPDDANPYSVRNTMNHLGEFIASKAGSAEAADDAWFAWHGRLQELAPRQATEAVVDLVRQSETEALKLGGKRIAGEVVVGAATRRRQAIMGITERLTLDKKQAKAIGNVVDSMLGWVDRVYVKKIEPNIIRPWSVAYLATMGYLPMNIVEDVIESTLYMGNFSRVGMSDAEFALQHAGDVVPVGLRDVERTGRDVLRNYMGQWDEAPTRTLLEKAADPLEIVRRASEAGATLRRASWSINFDQQFTKALRETGVPESTIKTFADIVQTEFPPGMEHLREELTSKVWGALRTGDPNRIREVKQIVSVQRLTQKSQSSVMTELTELPYNVRRAYKNAVWDEGGITPANAAATADEMTRKLMEWHRYTGESIKHEMNEAIRSIGFQNIKTPSEAMGVMRRMQHMGDTISQLPREVRSHFMQLANDSKFPAQKTQFHEEALRIIEQDLGEVRVTYAKHLEQVRPQIEAQLSELAGTVGSDTIKSSINEVFGAYTSIGDNLQGTWERYRAMAKEHFGSADDREKGTAFWDDFRRKGDEIWSIEREERFRQANIARTGWNRLFEALPPARTRRDREFTRQALYAAFQDADIKLNSVRIEIQELEASLDALPDSLKGNRVDRIENLKQEAVISADHRRSFEAKLQALGQKPSGQKLPDLAAADRSVRSYTAALDAAQKAGLDHQVGEWSVRVGEAQQARQALLEQHIPDYLKPEYTRLQAEVAATEAADSSVQGFVRGGAEVTPGIRRRLKGDINRARTALRRFERSIESGDVDLALSKTLRVSTDMTERAASAVLARNGGTVPTTVNDMIEVLAQAADEGDDAALQLISAVEATADRLPGGGSDAINETFQRVYAKVVQDADAAPISTVELHTLRQIQSKPIFPTREYNKLIEEGFVSEPTKNFDGRWASTLTEKGEAGLALQQNNVISLEDILKDMPSIVAEQQTVIESHVASIRGAIKQALDIAESPPATSSQMAGFNRYVDTVASEVGKVPDFQASMQSAKKVAAERTNVVYDEAFVNYDNRSNLDFVMQRFFPFWMYASRRWPRLLRLAAKRPVMSKYLAMMGGDWDYGHIPTPFGFEFMPAKGTLAGATRRLFSRDFPEKHEGEDWRGNLEGAMDDWFGRFGFYFNPAITGVASLLSGEAGTIAPPTLSLVLHGLSAAGVPLPEPLQSLTFDSKYTEFLTDRVIADKFEINPQELRRRMQNPDDTEAQGIMAAARREASLRQIALVQATVLRYNPQSRREFKANAEELVEEIIGISIEDQADLRRLGVSVYELVPVSGPQRKAMRESIPNYEAWVNNSLALRPIAEQRAVRAIDSFWADMEIERERYKVEIELLNRQWEEGILSGPNIREQYGRIVSKRSAAFDALQSRPEYSIVPFGIEERIDYAQKFGRPAPLVHPVDEALENFFNISPDEFTSAETGEVDWAGFFAKREGFIQALDDADPKLRALFDDARAKSETSLERALRIASPKIREYFGIQDQVIALLSPNGQAAYTGYRKLSNLSAQAPTEEESKYWSQQALQVSLAAPEVRQALIMVRFAREQLRKEDPEMEQVYRMFIASPQSFPSNRPQFGFSGIGGGLQTPARPVRPLTP